MNKKKSLKLYLKWVAFKKVNLVISIRGEILLKKLKRSINSIEAKVSLLKEGIDGLQNAVKDMLADFDAFIEVYTSEQDISGQK